MHDDEFERVRAGGVPRERFDHALAGLVVSAIVFATCIAIVRVADALVDDPDVDPLDRNALLRLVPWIRVVALVAMIVFAALLVRDVVRDVSARQALRRRRRDPLR